MKVVIIITVLFAIPALLFGQSTSVDDVLSRVADDAATMLNDTLGQQGSVEIAIGAITFEGRAVVLGEYLAAAIPIRLSAKAGNRISIITRARDAEFALTGQIFGLGENLKLFLTLLSSDEKVISGLEFSLLDKTAMASMLKPTRSSAFGGDEYEPDNFEQAAEVELGQRISGRLLQPSGDSDWFRFHADTISETVMLTVKTESNMDTYIEVYSEGNPSEVIAENDDGDDGDARVGVLLEPGQSILVKVRGYDTSETGSYELISQIVTAPEDPSEPDNSLEQAGPLEVSQSPVTRQIFPIGDSDWYEIEIPFGSEDPYLDVMIMSNLDTYMEIYDDRGDLLLEDDDGGSDSNARIFYGPAKPGKRYFVRVTHYEDGSIGEYRISAALSFPEHDAYEPDNDWENANEIRLSQRQSIRQRRNFSTHIDSDWVQFRIDSPATAVLFTTGNVDTMLYLYDEKGEIIQESDDDGSDRNGWISRYLAPGTYRLEIRQFEEEAEQGAEYGFEARIE